MGDVVVEWLTTHRRTWNGTMGGPVWRVRQGDRVNVTLVNTLQLPQKTQAINQQRFPNSSNLHTHGLHISSASPQDNVFVEVGPGETHVYQYEICPENPAGTYWYHPHLHGSTLFQVHSGMAGMIIVEDPADATTPDHLRAVSCPENCEHEVRLVFQPSLQYSGGGPRAFASIQDEIQDDAMFKLDQYTITTGVGAGGTLEAYLIDNVNYYTTNGQLWPNLNLPTGQVKRFRMVNAGGGALLSLQIVDTSNAHTTNCEVKQISLDGIYFDAPRTPKLDQTLLVPSAKADWLIVCNTAGSYKLRSISTNPQRDSIGNFESYVGDLLLLNVTGADASTTIGTTLPSRPSFVSDFRNTPESNLKGNFVIEASPGTRLNRERFSSSTDYRFKMEVGSIQQLFFTNSDPAAGHPIHIHINHFQVISYNEYTGPYAVVGRNAYVFFAQDGSRCDYQHDDYTGNENVNQPNNPLRYLGHETRSQGTGTGTLGYSTIGDFLDVILVPPLGNITTRFMAHKFTGEVVVHCHLLNHEDAGMMMVLEIVPVGSDLTANTASGNAYPGTCAQCDAFPFNAVSPCSVTTSADNTTTTTTTPTTTTTRSTTTSSAKSLSTNKIRHQLLALLLIWAFGTLLKT